MVNIRTQKNTKDHEVKKLLAEVDKVFSNIENDKELPTFGGFFMTCLIMGIDEKVNLKTMYPKVHKQLSKLLADHYDVLMAMIK